jgi:hypothetical protein
VDDGGLLVPAWLWPSDAAADTALALSMPVVDGSVARLEIVSPLPATALLLGDSSIVVVVESFVSASEPPRVSGLSPLWLSGPGTVIPILASTVAAVSWAAPGKLPVAAAAPVADAMVSAPAARSVLALSNLRDVVDLREGLVDGRTVRNTIAASASPATSASVPGCRAVASTPTTGR